MCIRDRLYALQTILGSFRNDGLLTTVSIDTYQRESNRYGGVALISKAETYFSYESKFVAQVITDNRFKDLSRDALDCVAIDVYKRQVHLCSLPQ